MSYSVENYILQIKTPGLLSSEWFSFYFYHPYEEDDGNKLLTNCVLPAYKTPPYSMDTDNVLTPPIAVTKGSEGK